MEGAIIHFGMHKTGSSSIQRSLAEHLDDPRFRYLRFASTNASGSIAIGFRANPVSYHGSRKRGASTSEIQRQRQEIHRNLAASLEANRSGKAIPILSAEYISMMKVEEFRGLCNFFGEHGYEVTTAGYVRSPKGFMESAFQQRLQGGYKAFEVAKFYPGYRRNFEKFETVLGKDRVRLWHFDTGTFPAGCVVLDFCRRLDIRFRAEDVLRVNEGLSLPAVSLLYAYRKLGPGYGVGPTVIRENNLLNQKIAQLRGPKLRFHSSLVAPVLEAQREDIAWMEYRLGASMSEEFARDDERAIRSEEELLTFAPETLKWLAEQLGPEYVERWRPGMTAREVAEWMHALRLKLVRESKEPRKQAPSAEAPRTGAAKAASTVRNGGDMTIEELVQVAKAAAPQILKQVPDEVAAALLREAFAEVARRIEAADNSVVTVAEFGRFRVRNVEAGDGKPATKRAIFKANSSA